jgi:hypothetical protein
MRQRLPATLPLLSLLFGCSVSVDYERASSEEPIAEARTAVLRPGGDTLASSLRSLGAPTYVWECDDGSVATAYAWEDGGGWGFSFGFALRNGVNASFSWTRERLDVPGVVLLFDEALALLQVRRGRLDEIAEELGRTRRPSVVE